MRAKIRRGFSIFMAAAVLSSGFSGTVFAERQEVSRQSIYGASADGSRTVEENGVTVTNESEFMDALKNRQSPITVDGIITIANGEDTDKRMLPIIFPAGTVVQATAESVVYVRSPIQLEGDGVCFKNIDLRFNSSTALGSVPHREIFLAGHSLTFDNVSTYLEGGGDLGSFGGTEEELLPTVYAGGYTGTVNGENASLTVKNSNDKTMFQAIYLGHEAESDNKAPYLGEAVLNLDAKAIVRERVDAALNSRAKITISGEENSYAKAKQVYGNENTTLTLNKSSVEEAIVENVGNLVLQEGACLSSKTDVLGNVTLKSGACLDLNAVEQAVISGNFAGVEDQAEEQGILVLNENGSVSIEGAVTGTTRFQTKNRLFPGTLLIGKSYISAHQETSVENNFVLPQSCIERGYELKYNEGVWSVDGQIPEDISISRIEIVSAPEKVDLRKIAAAEDETIPDEETFFEVNWYDGNGNVFSSEDVESNMLYEIDYVIRIRTDYWQSEETDILEKTDWYQPVSLMSSAENPGRYYLQAFEGAFPGDYTFLFCSNYFEGDLVTVADVKALKDTVLAEQRVIFYDQDIQEPEDPEKPTDPEDPKDPTDPEEHKHVYQQSVTKQATCTEKGIKTYTCGCGESYTEEIPAVGHKEVVDAAVAPTETTEGKTQGSHCSVCGMVLKAQEIIPATGGTTGPEEPKDPTDPEDPKDPTDPEEPKDPTDPEEHEHLYQERVTKQATCTEKGIRTYTCSCGKSYAEEISAVGHKYVERRIPATLKQDGYVQQVCSVCSASKNKSVIHRVNDVSLERVDFIFNGKAVTPSVTVKDSKGSRLSVGNDYGVIYAPGRKNPGIYTVTVMLKGDYSGSVARTFTIRPKGCSLGKLTAKSKGFQAAWKKQASQTSGYQLQYCTAKSFKAKTAKSVDIKKNTTLKTKVTKLRAKKKYYVRIRTYKTVKVNGKNIKLYSDWSKRKMVRTKK